MPLMALSYFPHPETAATRPSRRRTALIQQIVPPIQFADILPSGLTTIFPTIRGCSEQKYSYSPGAAKGWEKVSSVSSAPDLHFPSFSRTVCGLSSALIQVTVVPGATTKIGGVKLKLSIRTAAGFAAARTIGLPP